MSFGIRGWAADSLDEKAKAGGKMASKVAALAKKWNAWSTKYVAAAKKAGKKPNLAAAKKAFMAGKKPAAAMAEGFDALSDLVVAGTDPAAYDGSARWDVWLPADEKPITDNDPAGLAEYRRLTGHDGATRLPSGGSLPAAPCETGPMDESPVNEFNPKTLLAEFRRFMPRVR